MVMLNKNKKLVITILSALVLLAAAGVFFALKKGQINSSSEPVTKESNNVTNTDQPLTTDSAISSENKTLSPSPETSNPTQTGAPEKISITRAEASGEYFRVSGITSGPSSGSCILKLEKQGFTTITESAPIIVGPNYYTCDGFRIPLAKFPARGEWAVSITHQLGDRSTVSDIKNVTIN